MNRLLLLVVLIACCATVSGQNVILQRTSIGASGSVFINSKCNITLSQSIGQSSSINRISSNQVQLSQGFIQPVDMNSVIMAKSHYIIFPNPTYGELNVWLDNVPNEPVLVTIHSVDGKQLQHYKVNELQSAFYLSGLSKGLYYLVVQMGLETKQTHKIILK